MAVKTWKVLDFGEVPETAIPIPYECTCGVEAMLPVKGVALAICGGHYDDKGKRIPDAVVFDGPGRLPREIQCRKCRRIFTLDLPETA